MISYKEEVVNKLGQIFLSLLDMLASKKFIAALGGGWATYQATGDAWAILWAAIAYIVAQAAADFGKESALVNAVMSAQRQLKEEKKARELPVLNVSQGTPLGDIFPIPIKRLLEGAGFYTVEDLRQAEDSKLLEVVSEPVLQKIRELIQSTTHS